jgi:proteasome lid subunit RPN8/RPN11
VTDLQAVRVYLTRGDAEVARARLVGEGINAVVIADNEGGLNPGFYAHYGVRVVVRSEDLDRARSVLGGDFPSVRVHPEMAEAIVQHGRFAAPDEACGLLAVDDAGDLRMVYCLTNVDRSALRFTVAPHEHYHAWKHAERNGWRIGGVFHSHTESAAEPSEADVTGALDPSWVYMIVGPMSAPEPQVRAYRIVHGEVEEMTIHDG